MRVYGIDFTSVPTPRKPICVAACRLDGETIHFERLERVNSLNAFEASLRVPGPWIGGFDFPFTQSRTFLLNMGWPLGWPDFAGRLEDMSRDGWRKTLEDYKSGRAAGDREHSRGFEKGTRAASPQKLYGVPVALMQFEGVPRLRRAGVSIPGLAAGDRSRIAVEAYPGVTARALIGSAPYKNDARAKQTPGLAAARMALLAALRGEAGRERFGLRVEAPAWLADDATGDALDALVCAVQAAWALRLIEDEPERLAGLNTSEGWIAEPSVVSRLAPVA